MRAAVTCLLLCAVLSFVEAEPKVDNLISNTVDQGSDNIVVKNDINPPNAGDPVSSKNHVKNSLADTTPKIVRTVIRGTEHHSPLTPENENAINNKVNNAKPFPLHNIVYSHHPDSKKTEITNTLSGFQGGDVVNRLNDQRDAKKPNKHHGLNDQQHH